jgi:hypothetical protein
MQNRVIASANEESRLPGLFAHSRRTDWGLAVLKDESDGKRRYLFEDGQERTVARGFEQLMLRVEEPSVEQHATLARLQKLLARGARASAAHGMVDPSAFDDQVTRLKQTYPEGLADSGWASEMRGEGAEQRSRKHRQAAIDEAKEQLSQQALDALLSSQKYAEVVERLIALLKKTDLVSGPQLTLKTNGGDPHRELAIALRECLYGAAPYPVRLDRYIAALATAFGAHPRWELATALSSLVQPTEHVAVEPASFRRQLKSLATKRTIATKPTSADYATCLTVARNTGKKLAEHGEAPRDLFDVRDFMVFTLAKPARPKA